MIMNKSFNRHHALVILEFLFENREAVRVSEFSKELSRQLKLNQDESVSVALYILDKYEYEHDYFQITKKNEISAM